MKVRRLAVGYSSRIIEYGTILFFVCLLFKLSAFGILLLLVLACTFLLTRGSLPAPTAPLAIFAILYAADATTTAFLISIKEGVFRTMQWGILTMAALSLVKYTNTISPTARNRFLMRFVKATLFFYVIMILYHVMIGRYTTWKYLYDTKTLISIVIIILFSFEERLIRRVGNSGFLIFVGASFVLTLLSGERKALLIFGLCLLVSHIRLKFKLGAGVVILAGAVLLLALGGPDNYTARQLRSIFDTENHMTESDFYATEAIGDRSDIIREFVNRNARELFLENPLMGIGATGYQVWANQNFNMPGDPRGMNMNVHGEINRIPVEGGIIGILIVACYFLCVVLFFLRRYKYATLGVDVVPSRNIIYCSIFLYVYVSYEALDTLMLSFILLHAFECVRIDRQLALSWRKLKFEQAMRARFGIRHDMLVRGFGKRPVGTP